jgi:hypothetical protein
MKRMQVLSAKRRLSVWRLRDLAVNFRKFRFVSGVPCSVVLLNFTNKYMQRRTTPFHRGALSASFEPFIHTWSDLGSDLRIYKTGLHKYSAANFSP